MRKGDKVIYQPPEPPDLTLLARVSRVYSNGTVDIYTTIALGKNPVFDEDDTVRRTRRVSRDHVKPFIPNRERN
jgi:hypothetical protein